MGLKFMQNSNTTIEMGGETTMTRVDLYKGHTLIGSAGVKNPKDFDYYALLNFAKCKPGSKMQVA